jgi:hypothetical protein
MKCNAADGLFSKPSRLFDTDLPNLREISLAQQSLSNPILHEGRHAVFDGLKSQLLHFSTVLDQHFHIICPGD